MFKSGEEERRHKAVSEIRCDITTDFTGIKRVIRKFCEQLYVNKFNNLDKVISLKDTND